MAQGVGGKPKGMHWKTYWRLKGAHVALMQVSLDDMGRKLGILGKLLESCWKAESVSKNAGLWH